MPTIGSLSTLAKTSVTANHWLVIADTAGNANYKLAAQDLFPSLTTLGTGSESLFISITNKNVLNFKGIASASNLLTVSTVHNNILLTVDPRNINLATCDNTASQFLSSVALTSNVTGILPVANGGTGLASITAGAFLVGNETGAPSLLGPGANGQIPIGRSGLAPVMATLTAGTNVSIVNASGSITINAGFTTFTQNINANNFNLYGLKWLSGNGNNEGLQLDSTGRIFVGSNTPTPFFAADLNVQQNIYLQGGLVQTIKAADAATPVEFILAGSAATTVNAGGNVELRAGGSMGSKDGGNILLFPGNHDGSGTSGNIILFGYSTAAVLQEIARFDGRTKRFGVNEDSPDFTLHVKQSDAAANLPVIGVEQLDTGESFINFIGTSGAASANSISSSSATAGTKVGAIQVKVNGTVRWIRLYDTAE
jgi:hypothetical protein